MSLVPGTTLVGATGFNKPLICMALSLSHLFAQMLSMREEMFQEFIAAPEVAVEEEVMSKLETKCNVRLGEECLYPPSST